MRGTDARECSIFFLRENATKSEVRVMRCQSVCVCSAGGFSIISSSFCQVCSGCSVQIGLAVSFFILFIYFFCNFISYFVVFIFWSEKGCIFTLLFLPALLGRASVRPDASSCSSIPPSLIWSSLHSFWLGPLLDLGLFVFEELFMVK